MANDIHIASGGTIIKFTTIDEHIAKIDNILKGVNIKAGELKEKFDEHKQKSSRLHNDHYKLNEITNKELTASKTVLSKLGTDMIVMNRMKAS